MTVCIAEKKVSKCGKAGAKPHAYKTVDGRELKLDLPLTSEEAELVHRMVSDIVKPF